MKTKMFTLTLVCGLLLTLISCVNGTTKAKVKREHHGTTINVESASENSANVKPSSNYSALTKEMKKVSKEKALRKRDVIHYDDLRGTELSNIWSHYGHRKPFNAPLNFQSLPSSHLHSTGIHFNAPIPLLPAVTPLNHGVSDFKQHLRLTLPSSYVLRPGGAVIQAYNVRYPHHKSLLTLGAIKSTHRCTALDSVQQLHPAPPVQSLPFYYLLHNSFTPTIHSGQSSVIYHHSALQPITPPMAQVHEVPDVVSCITPTAYQYHPHLLQNSFGSSGVPVVSLATSPTLPVIPSYTKPAQFPDPPLHTLPVPTAPAVPPLPEVPVINNIPNIPQRPNTLFPGHTQSPLPYDPSTFVPVSGKPLVGNIDASLQISPPSSHPLSPSISLPKPNPQRPSLSEIWKPSIQKPESTIVTLHPSHTLLPPLNSSGETYLPPDHNSPSPNQKLQHMLNVNSQLFDGLSEAEFEQIFTQANYASQNDNLNHHKHPHAVHTYSQY